MRVLLDTNVVLDLLLDREPWSSAAVAMFTEIESGNLEGYLCATTVTTLHYLATKTVGAKKARQDIRSLLALCAVAPVNRAVLDAAVDLDFADFEDGVLYEAACLVGVDAIVTRNAADFKRAEISILSPQECLEILAQLAQVSRGDDEPRKPGE